MGGWRGGRKREGGEEVERGERGRRGGREERVHVSTEPVAMTMGGLRRETCNNTATRHVYGNIRTAT